MKLENMGAVFSATVKTPDGPFTLITDETGTVLASGWSASIDEIAARVRPGSLFATPAYPVRDFPHMQASAGLKGANGASRVPGGGAGGAAAVEAVEAYYAGELDAPMRVPVRGNGTELQEAGWRVLREIRPGEPLTYTSFATALGRPSAVRAAASICARNPTGLFVPCHRVQRGDGSLGGFAWGLDTKRALLEREGLRAL